MSADVWSDRIQEIGIIVAALAGLATAWQGRKLSELKAKVEQLEAAIDLKGKKFHAAVLHIREWMKWERQPEPRGPVPVVPADIAEDV